MRIVHEASLYWNSCGNCFITLTYRDKHECTADQLAQGHYIPEDGSLNKKHFQDFIKRLRKRFPQRIRYFHCGEYGDQTWRPHYHACLFNVDFSDTVVYREREGIFTYTSDILSELWPYGFSTVGELNHETAMYTAGYVFKKITGKKAEDHYLRADAYGVAYWLEPEYCTMSRRPGLGRHWYEEYNEDVFPADETPIPGKGVSRKVPRYYEEIYKSENPSEFELVREMRQKFIEEHAHDFTPARLKAKYDCHKAKHQRRTEI